MLLLKYVYKMADLDNLEGLLAILNHLARSIGSNLSVANFAQESGLSHPTAKKYLGTMSRPVKTFLFYTGREYGDIDGVKLIPIVALYRGK